jgi:hypothetical protein
MDRRGISHSLGGTDSTARKLRPCIFFKATRCRPNELLLDPVEITLLPGPFEMEAGMQGSSRDAGSSNLLEFQLLQGELMSATASDATAVLMFPAGMDTHWETQIRTVWNERAHTSEELELVYEVSWIAELGAWRRFLRSQRQVKG